MKTCCDCCIILEQARASVSESFGAPIERTPILWGLSHEFFSDPNAELAYQVACGYGNAELAARELEDDADADYERWRESEAAK